MLTAAAFLKIRLERGLWVGEGENVEFLGFEELLHLTKEPRASPMKAFYIVLDSFPLGLIKVFSFYKI